jgi:hypothetical protein
MTKKKVNNRECCFTMSVAVFARNDAVRGTVVVNVLNGNQVQHVGIKIFLIGQIGSGFYVFYDLISLELFYDRGRHIKFLSDVKELDQPGCLTQSKHFPFHFEQEKVFQL